MEKSVVKCVHAVRIKGWVKYGFEKVWGVCEDGGVRKFVGGGQSAGVYTVECDAYDSGAGNLFWFFADASK